MTLRLSPQLSAFLGRLKALSLKWSDRRGFYTKFAVQKALEILREQGNRMPSEGYIQVKQIWMGAKIHHGEYGEKCISIIPEKENPVLKSKGEFTLQSLNSSVIPGIKDTPGDNLWSDNYYQNEFRNSSTCDANLIALVDKLREPMARLALEEMKIKTNRALRNLSPGTFINQPAIGAKEEIIKHTEYDIRTAMSSLIHDMPIIPGDLIYDVSTDLLDTATLTLTLAPTNGNPIHIGVTAKKTHYELHAYRSSEDERTIENCSAIFGKANVYKNSTALAEALGEVVVAVAEDQISDYISDKRDGSKPRVSRLRKFQDSIDSRSSMQPNSPPPAASSQPPSEKTLA